MPSFGFVLLRYWHTLRWLRPVQIVGRIWHRLYRPRPDARPAPALILPPGHWRPCVRVPSLVGAETFQFLSVTRSVRTSADWDRAEWPKLWRYNAHYFDDLVADNAAERKNWHCGLIARWIAENPPGQGTGWEPYPTSLRIVNWLKWLLVGNSPVPGMLDSLAVQVRWLRRRLEYHLLGNHLWANAKALVFAGVCFGGSEAAQWRQVGMGLLQRELREQVLADGGHFERSPMYHAIFTEDLLDLLQLGQLIDVLPTEVVQSLRQTAIQMLDWAGVMAHPDGEVAFFNDAAFGIARPLTALRAYAQMLGVPLPAQPEPGLRLLEASGYVRAQNEAALLLVDVAPVGPDYLPGHAHADTLSFELSLHGRRALVNGGTSTYENDAERLLQRGTLAHNTVTVDGQDSSEVWSAFRVARRARVHDIRVQQGDILHVSAWHDGYERLPGKVRHHRRWQLAARTLLVEDKLEGKWQEAEARFRFAPGAASVLRWHVDGGEVSIQRAIWCPRFGEQQPTHVLVVRFLQPCCAVRFEWD